LGGNLPAGGLLRPHRGAAGRLRGGHPRGPRLAAARRCRGRPGRGRAKGRLSAREPFAFGPFRFDPERRILWRGDALVEIAPRALDLLAALVARAGDVVTKDELMRAVWPDTFVEEANLSVNVAALRKALGDAPGGRSYIQTVPRRGYRLVPPTAGEPRRPRVAILPFRVLGGDADDDAGVGTAVALITRLSRIPSLVVRPLSAVLAHAGADARAAARDLKVDAVVEGTVQRSGRRARVTVHLVRAAEEAASWSDSFEEDVASLFAAQDRAAERVARALDVELRTADHAVLARRDTADAKASQAYLKGRLFWGRFTAESMTRAFASFQEAVERDPAYALPHAGLADAYLVLGFSGLVPPRDAWERAEQSAREALRLDPTLADAHIALGYVRLFRDWDWGGALQSVERALELNPGAPAHQWLGTVLAMQGDMAGAQRHVDEAFELEPLAVVTGALRGLVLSLARDHARELKHYLALAELYPDHLVVLWGLGLAYEHAGHVEESVATLARAEALAGEGAMLRLVRARAEALAGRPDEARRALEESDAAGTETHYQRATVLAALGDRDEAIGELKRAAEAREPWVVWVRVDPMLDALRGDGRFEATVSKVFGRSK
jgi:DNA-binding winged helix-turn-helix (wHTH) protein/tetratricopeptide (TPR) repeat protein